MSNNMVSNCPLSGRLQAIERLGGDEGLYAKYVERFQASYAHGYEALALLIDTAKYEDAMIFVHSLKGLAATLGMNELASQSEDIEAAISKGRFTDLPLLLYNFQHSLSEVIQSDIDHKSSSEGTGLSGLK